MILPANCIHFHMIPAKIAIGYTHGEPALFRFLARDPNLDGA